MGAIVMITLPQKILDALPLIKGRIVAAKSTKLYAKVNHRDNFVLVIALDIIGELMDIVVTMSGEELSVDDWWDKGFRVRPPQTSSNTPDHSEFYKVSRKIAGEIYDELR